jgi:hypothetical protein
MTNASIESDKFLLCRPQGGFNDLLSQIEKCCRYADVSGRTIIVETDCPGSHSFFEPLSNYFSPRQPNLILDASTWRDKFDQMDVWPSSISKRVNSYRADWSDEHGSFVEIQNSLPVSFDFAMDYPQKLLVHHDCGGEDLAHFFFYRVRVQECLVAELKQRLASVKRPYFAVHIRNTDYRTDYEQGLRDYLAKIPQQFPIFVATDSKSTLDHCKVMIGAGRVLTFCDFDQADDRQLHRTAPSLSIAKIRNKDAILDLFMLALADSLCIFKLQANTNQMDISGFSRLARNLNQNRRLLIQTLSSRGAPF